MTYQDTRNINEFPTHGDVLALWIANRGSENTKRQEGLTQFAQDMKVPMVRARRWNERGFIPPWYWLRLIECVQHRHGKTLTLEQLTQATERLRGKSSDNSVDVDR